MYDELVKALRETRERVKSNPNVAMFVPPYQLSAAADAIEELSKPKWIPVTERLPENICEEVLVCNSEYGKSNLGFVTVAIYDGSGWLECWQRKTYLVETTHWMPIPKPPKEET